MDAERLYQLSEPIVALSERDRELVASAIGDTGDMIDEDLGDDADARRKAYTALASLVQELRA